MGADNWAVCPKCKAKRKYEKEQTVEKVEAAYGKVSASEYLKMRDEANASREVKDSLREDYEIGMTELGVFYVIYSCSCGDCGFSFSYRLEKKDLEK